MPGIKTNERDGTRAVLRNTRVSAYKAREVLDLIRGQDVARAADTLRFCERDVALPVAKLLASAVANAANNDDLSNAEELFVSACFADEGTTIKRWRPRARGRATRIRKRTCHITVIVSRMPEDRIRRVAAKSSGPPSAQRARRVAAGRRAAARANQSTPAELSPEELTGAEVEVSEAVVQDTFAETAEATEGAGTTETAEVTEATETAESAEATGSGDLDEDTNAVANAETDKPVEAIAADHAGTDEGEAMDPKSAVEQHEPGSQGEDK
ncbi:MAG: 50S ribosomal protein L22 [Acidimicrobiales bacterium]